MSPFPHNFQGPSRAARSNVCYGWNADIRNYYSLRGFARCHDYAPRAKAGDRPLISERHGSPICGEGHLMANTSILSDGKVLYTARTYTTGGRDGSSRS